MNATHGPVVLRRRLGAALKRLRTRRGLLLGPVARQLEISPSKLSRLETGQVEPKTRDVRDLLDVYAAGPETREEVMRWTIEAKQAGWWQPVPSEVWYADLDLYLSLEAEARSALVYSLPINGLLQTEEYARSSTENALPEAGKAEVERLVAIRIGRQDVLRPDRPDNPPLILHSVIDESSLHRLAVDAAVAVPQLELLLALGEQPNVTVQVLPFSAGPCAVSSSFAIFEPRSGDDWPVVGIESAGVDAYVDTPEEVDRFRSLWSQVVGRSLDPGESTTLIRDLLRGQPV